MKKTIDEMRSEILFVLNYIKFDTRNHIFIINRSLLGSVITKVDNKLELNFENIQKFDDDEYEKRVDLRLHLKYLFDKELKISKN